MSARSVLRAPPKPLCGLCSLLGYIWTDRLPAGQSWRKAGSHWGANPALAHSTNAWAADAAQYGGFRMPRQGEGTIWLPRELPALYWKQRLPLTEEHPAPCLLTSDGPAQETLRATSPSLKVDASGLFCTLQRCLDPDDRGRWGDPCFRLNLFVGPVIWIQNPIARKYLPRLAPQN